MSNIIHKFYNLNEMDTNDILRKISEMAERAERERQIYGVKDLDDYILSLDDYILSMGLDVYNCMKNHCLKNHIFDNPPIYESGIICSPYMHDELEFEVLTPDVFSPWTVVLRKKSEPLTLYRKTLREAKAAMNSVFDLKLHNSKMLEYAANDISTIKTLYNKIYNLEQKHIENVIFNDPATIVFWNDGTKTVVKVQNEKFDPEKGLAMAIAKKYFGNHGNYYNEFKKWLPVEEAKWKDPVEKVCSRCKYFMFSTVVEPCRSCFISPNRSNWQRDDK